MRGRRDGDYVRFLEATLELADAGAALPRRARFRMAMTILRMCETERIAQAALFERSPRRLERAESEIDSARTMLADVALDARRSLSLVA